MRQLKVAANLVEKMGGESLGSIVGGIRVSGSTQMYYIAGGGGGRRRGKTGKHGKLGVKRKW